MERPGWLAAGPQPIRLREITTIKAKDRLLQEESAAARSSIRLPGRVRLQVALEVKGRIRSHQRVMGKETPTIRHPKGEVDALQNGSGLDK